MPRPKRRAPRQQLTPGQAAYVLQRLVRDRKISAAELNRYVSDLGQEIKDLENRLAALRAAHAAGPVAAGAAAPVRRRRRVRKAAAAAAPAKAAKAGKRAKAAITPEQLASRQLQGRYLGLVRQFSVNRRAYYAKVAKDRGREAAIKEMLEARK